MSRRRYAAAVLLSTLPLVASASPAPAADYTIDAARSVFAVLTHKAGIGSGLAHDHLIVAPRPAVKLAFDALSPEATKLNFTVAVDALEIDAPGPRAAWKARFKELGIHSGELPIVSDGDRRKVRAAMLGETQLDSARFPEIKAEVLGLTRRGAPTAAPSGASQSAQAAGTLGETGWSVRLRVVLHGKTIERQLPATWSEKEGNLTAEILGEFGFKEFGIEPYSTMLGAIRNDDRFHLYVNVVARRAP